MKKIAQRGPHRGFVGTTALWMVVAAAAWGLAGRPLQAQTAEAPAVAPSQAVAQAPPAITATRYTLQPGDIMDLGYRFTPDLNQVVTIQPDGYVNLNLVGSVKVAGLTVDEAHDLIVKKASVQLNEPELNLTLKEFQQSSVVVAGEVQKPGKVPVHSGMTALQAILMTGGFSENAKAGQVILFRQVDAQRAEVHLLKLDKLTHSVDMQHDLKLEPGDMILVPRDTISILTRYIKLANVGFYFNPLQNIP